MDPKLERIRELHARTRVLRERCKLEIERSKRARAVAERLARESSGEHTPAEPQPERREP